jgi:hypothetical protein
MMMMMMMMMISSTFELRESSRSCQHAEHNYSTFALPLTKKMSEPAVNVQLSRKDLSKRTRLQATQLQNYGLLPVMSNSLTPSVS